MVNSVGRRAARRGIRKLAGAVWRITVRHRRQNTRTGQLHGSVRYKR